jgi:hypothetical protein
VGFPSPVREPNIKTCDVSRLRGINFQQFEHLQIRLKCTDFRKPPRKKERMVADICTSIYAGSTNATALIKPERKGIQLFALKPAKQRDGCPHNIEGKYRDLRLVGRDMSLSQTLHVTMNKHAQNVPKNTPAIMCYFSHSNPTGFLRVLRSTPFARPSRKNLKKVSLLPHMHKLIRLGLDLERFAVVSKYRLIKQ